METRIRDRTPELAAIRERIDEAIKESNLDAYSTAKLQELALRRMMEAPEGLHTFPMLLEILRALEQINKKLEEIKGAIEHDQNS